MIQGVRNGDHSLTQACSKRSRQDSEHNLSPTSIGQTVRTTANQRRQRHQSSTVNGSRQCRGDGDVAAVADWTPRDRGDLRKVAQMPALDWSLFSPGGQLKSTLEGCWEQDRSSCDLVADLSLSLSLPPFLFSQKYSTHHQCRYPYYANVNNLQASLTITQLANSRNRLGRDCWPKRKL